MHEFLISYGHTKWYFLFSDSVTTSAHFEFGAKSRTTDALVNLYFSKLVT